MDLEKLLHEYVHEQQIPIFGVASVNGFHQALPGYHPKDFMPRCESVVVIGLPFIEHPLLVEEKTHRANTSWWETNQAVVDQTGAWRADILNLLDQHGLGAANFGGYGANPEPNLSYRLAQFEAGLGVFGRFGVCINPEYGCYYRAAVLLTDAVLSPSDRDSLSDFSPCEDCRECADVCPVRAIDVSQPPESGYNRDLCFRFIHKLKERRGTDFYYCSRCFSVCPWGVGRFSQSTPIIIE
jgi:epoxyqueuosine reductase QueG